LGDREAALANAYLKLLPAAEGSSEFGQQRLYSEVTERGHSAGVKGLFTRRP
jgi:hypothetical protein